MRAPLLLLAGLSVTCSLIACGGTVTAEPQLDGGATDTASPADTGAPAPCSMLGMCTLVPRSCCGSCGQPTRTDQIAVPREQVGDYRTLACTTDAGPSACPACARAPDPELQAFCVDGGCRPVFVPADAISACAKDDDCVLVSGVCCGICDGTESHLVAVARGKEGEFASQICDPRADCGPCATPMPFKSKARCDLATRHCVTDRAR